MINNLIVNKSVQMINKIRKLRNRQLKPSKNYHWKRSKGNKERKDQNKEWPF